MRPRAPPASRLIGWATASTSHSSRRRARLCLLDGRCRRSRRLSLLSLSLVRLLSRMHACTGMPLIREMKGEWSSKIRGDHTSLSLLPCLIALAPCPTCTSINLQKQQGSGVAHRRRGSIGLPASRPEGELRNQARDRSPPPRMSLPATDRPVCCATGSECCSSV